MKVNNVDKRFLYLQNIGFHDVKPIDFMGMPRNDASLCFGRDKEKEQRPSCTWHIFIIFSHAGSFWSLTHRLAFSRLANMVIQWTVTSFSPVPNVFVMIDIFVFFLFFVVLKNHSLYFYFIIFLLTNKSLNSRIINCNKKNSVATGSRPVSVGIVQYHSFVFDTSP